MGWDIGASIARSGIRWGHRAHLLLSEWCEDMYALMRAFDLFVHSAVQPDPLPTVCIYALAVGCPSIGYDTGGVGEIILDREYGEYG
ncbi:MAG: glycosyltransferase [Chloroflexi bacterium]|nr:glycosyltransferase [Chloroflexota bacterium]